MTSKLTDEQIAELAERSTDKISKALHTKVMKTAKQKYGFDISDYEFSDKGVLSCHNSKCGKLLLIRSRESRFGSLEVNKQDAIALAKHFKLTAEDLK